MLWNDAPQSLNPSEDFFRTPIFIHNFNQVSYLRRLIGWLSGAGYKNICIIDNNSTYPPLLTFYAELESASTINVVRRDGNGSKTVLWDDGLLERFGVTGPFVLTDSDVVPEAFCPGNALSYLATLLRNYPHIFKAGLGLRIDNLPASYKFRDEAITWEMQFWNAPVCRGAFLAPIDTTFALYRPQSAFALRPSLRTDWPYLARHETWYQDSANLAEEQSFYRSEVDKGSRGHWGRSEIPQKKQIALAEQIKSNANLLYLGNGRRPTPGWLSLDQLSADSTRAANRLAYSDRVDGFFFCDTLENVEAILPMMKELHRLAKPGARFIIRLTYDVILPTTKEMSNRLQRHLSNGFKEFHPACSQPDHLCAADWQVVRVKLIVNQGLTDSERDAQVLKRVADEPSLIKEMIIELRAMKPPRKAVPDLAEEPRLIVTGDGFDEESTFQRLA